MLGNNTYVPPRDPGVVVSVAELEAMGQVHTNRLHRTNHRDNSRQPVRCCVGLPNRGDTTKALLHDVLILFIMLCLVDGLAIVWIDNRIRKFTQPLRYQSFTEGGYRYNEQLLCFAAGVALFCANVLLWGSIALRLNCCLMKKLGLNSAITRWTPMIPWRDAKIAGARLNSLFLVIVGLALAILIPLT